LAAFAFRYFPISSNNRNRAKPYRKFCEFLLNSCGKSHPLAHKFHAQLAISFGFSFFFHFFAAWALKRFVLFSCTCLLRLCCENRKKKARKVAAATAAATMHESRLRLPLLELNPMPAAHMEAYLLCSSGGFPCFPLPGKGKM